jgi:DNA-binding Lrp family transcriptional regulator
MSTFTELEKELLDAFQRDLPLTPRPYAELARKLGVTEEEVLHTLERLQCQGAVSRVGAVFRPGRLGASTLAAMSVPAARLQEVAALVNGYSEVNHNYEREHELNLWFVVTAATAERVSAVLEEIEERTGLRVLDLPLIEDYHIDLGFRLWS